MQATVVPILYGRTDFSTSLAAKALGVVPRIVADIVQRRKSCAQPMKPDHLGFSDVLAIGLERQMIADGVLAMAADHLALGARPHLQSFAAFLAHYSMGGGNPLASGGVLETTDPTYCCWFRHRSMAEQAPAIVAMATVTSPAGFEAFSSRPPSAGVGWMFVAVPLLPLLSRVTAGLDAAIAQERVQGTRQAEDAPLINAQRTVARR